MVNRTSYRSCSLFLFCASVYALGELSPRNAAYCAYLVDKIFCYGGSPNDKSYDTSVNLLDLNQPDNDDVNSLLNRWNTNVVPTGGYDIATELRYDCQYTVLPDGRSILMQGGSNELSDKIPHQNVVYNALTSTWSALPDYNDTLNGGKRQIFAGTATYIPSLNKIAFYGGLEMQISPNYTYTLLNGTHLPTNYTYHSYRRENRDYYESFVGFYYLTFFDLITNEWSIPSQNNFNYFPQYPTATYHPSSDTIYYLGGQYYNLATNNLLTVPLSWCLTFNARTSIWSNITLTAENKMPEPRYQHTATLLTTTGNDIVVYGGTRDAEVEGALMDYCYTLNLTSLSWTYHSPTPPSGISGPRFYHNAVLVKDTSLFILLGKPKSETVTNDILVLDVRNASQLQFSNYYPLRDVSLSNNASLSSGAIAGIVVGVVVAVLIAVLFIVYVIRKKKKQALEEPEVDWDNIEQRFDDITDAQKTTETFRYSNNFTTPSSTVVARMSQVPDSVDTNKTLEPSNAKEVSQTNITKPDIRVSEVVSTTNVSEEK